MTSLQVRAFALPYNRG